jgi:hypothetical protein
MRTTLSLSLCLSLSRKMRTTLSLSLCLSLSRKMRTTLSLSLTENANNPLSLSRKMRRTLSLSHGKCEQPSLSLTENAKNHTDTFGRFFSVVGNLALFRRHLSCCFLTISSLSREKSTPQEFSYKFLLGLKKKLGFLSYYLFPSVVKYI